MSPQVKAALSRQVNSTRPCPFTRFPALGPVWVPMVLARRQRHQPEAPSVPWTPLTHSLIILITSTTVVAEGRRRFRSRNGRCRPVGSPLQPQWGLRLLLRQRPQLGHSSV
jgi:hypothetical protein